MDEREKATNTDGLNMTRRGFMARLAGLLAAAGLGGAAAACAPAGAPEAVEATPTFTPANLLNPEVPAAPGTMPDSALLRFFTPHEARTVEAITARILPGTPEDPGAREAGVVNYIDYMLAAREGFAEPTYRDAPFAEVYEGETPPESTFNVVWVAAEEIERYGYQSRLTPREVYRLGVGYLDGYARTTFGALFADLSEADQDTMVGALVEGKATGFDQFSPKAFFAVLRRHTGEGMFSDPAYGGNRDMVGWKLIGFSGAQRAWTPIEIKTEGTRHAPQSLAELPPFHAGEQAGTYVVQPVSGAPGDSEYGPFGPVDDPHQAHGR
jgi:gluconate 2-dehydrogenase gamma chain